MTSRQAMYGGYQGQPRKPPPRWLAVVVLVLSGLYTVIACVHAVLAFHVGSALRNAVHGLHYDHRLIAVSDQLDRFDLPTLVACFVVGCLWLHRSYTFAGIVNPQFRPRHTVAWVWTGWFVPIVAWWFPYQVLTDIRAATERVEPTRRWLRWWLIFLVARALDDVASFLMTRLGSGRLDAAQYEALIDPYVAVTVTAAVLLVAACALWVRYVVELLGLQRQRAAEQLAARTA